MFLNYCFPVFIEWYIWANQHFSQGDLIGKFSTVWSGIRSSDARKKHRAINSTKGGEEGR